LNIQKKERDVEMEQYIVSCDEMFEQKLVNEFTDSYIQNKIQQWVYTFFKHPVPKYAASMIPNEIDSFIYDELTNKRAEILISVMDYSRRANKSITTVDKKFILKDNNINHLHYFKEFETIFCEYSFSGNSFRLFYAKNDEKFMNFVSYFNKQNRRLNLGKIDFIATPKMVLIWKPKKLNAPFYEKMCFWIQK